MKTEKRMDKPMDKLAKRQAAYAGDVIHEFHELPGKFIKELPNEYPDSQMTLPKVDSAYLVDINGRECIINREDESGPLNQGFFKRINNYRILLEYAFKKPVIQVITTHALVDKSLITVDISPTMYEDIIVVSYPTLDGSERLSTIKEKINHDELLSNVEAMNLVMIPRMFTSGNAEILEEVCVLMKKAKIEDPFFKCELTFQMRCIIHKYAETLDDIIRLEGVIDLSGESTAFRQYKDGLINQGIEQGIEQGTKIGSFEMALKLKKALGLEKAVEISGFSREELENEQFDR